MAKKLVECNSVSQDLSGHWRVHTTNMLNEILGANQTCAIFSIPFNIFGKLLAQVADRAIELNDPELNILMLRLTLYEIDGKTPEEQNTAIQQAIEEQRKRIKKPKKKK